ncbi:MAG: glycosyltransferase family 2 protein [Rhodobacteraceae bacterium]|nr:glycosyltransferase family 2 protein [Paracoccaceae bacterium]
MGLLDAVAWPEEGGRAFRVTLAAGTPPGALAPAAEGDRPALQQVSGGLVLAGRAGPEGPITLRLRDGEAAQVFPGDPEWPLFEGLDSALLLANHETPEAMGEVLRHHAEWHGLQAALVMTRATGVDALEPVARALTRALSGARGLVRVVLVASPHPLGRTDLADEAHPFNAPDAPGKDRMEIPPPDPVRAPLGQGAIFEVLRWRWLARARAVVSLDASDILAPADGPRLFDLVQEAPGGVVPLAGRRAYPWRVRPDRPAHVGDHICHQFDNPGGNRRWCVAPLRLDPACTWRFTRIGGVAGDPALTRLFWRCMALRHPGRAVSELVPKTSLVESDALLSLAEGPFGHKPVRAPRSVPHADPAEPAIEAGRTAIVTTMKNEGPFILEWLAYHRAIGVDDFLVYTNDCTDGTDTLLDLLQRKGLVQHRENPFRQTELKPQHAALQAAEAEPLIANAGWVICMDVDEFLAIHAGRGHLADLYRAVGEANMISVTWRLFGNSDVHLYEDRFLLEQFTRCAPEFVRKPHQAWGFKTLFRNIGIYKKLGVHRPKGLRPDLWDSIRWVNGSGRRMPREMLRNGWRSTTTTYGYDLVTLNHYAVRSAESFLVKRDRGRVNHVDRDQGMNYWFRMNNNAEEDRSIQRMLPELRAEWDRLMADPEIAAQHQACVAAHRAKIVELKARPDQAVFYGELTSRRMERLSRLHTHFGSAVFLAGPEVIPDAFLDSGPPADAFFTLDIEGRPVLARMAEAPPEPEEDPEEDAARAG